MTRLPYDDVRIIEKSATLTGRLIGLLFADQGAEVFIERAVTAALGEHDGHLDRGKIAIPPGALADTSSADMIIVDGAVPVSRGAAQIVLRVTAAFPGDETYGHLAADCSEDLLNALVGIFTDMAGFGRLLGRPVIYTPLPICSVYAGVLGAIAVGAALVDRERSGAGPRDRGVAPGGRTVSHRGAHADIERHSAAPGAGQCIGGAPAGVTPARFQGIVQEAARHSAAELWLAQRRAPLASPFAAADGRLVLPMVSPNRRLTERFLKALGRLGRGAGRRHGERVVLRPERLAVHRSQSGGLAVAGCQPHFDVGRSRSRPPLRASRRPSGSTSCAAQECRASRFRVGRSGSAIRKAHAAGIFAEVRGSTAPQIGRSAWVASAQPYPALESCRRADALPPRAHSPRTAPALRSGRRLESAAGRLHGDRPVQRHRRPGLWTRLRRAWRHGRQDRSDATAAFADDHGDVRRRDRRREAQHHPRHGDRRGARHPASTRLGRRPGVWPTSSIASSRDWDSIARRSRHATRRRSASNCRRIAARSADRATTTRATTPRCRVSPASWCDSVGRAAPRFTASRPAWTISVAISARGPASPRWRRGERRRDGRGDWAESLAGDGRIAGPVAAAADARAGNGPRRRTPPAGRRANGSTSSPTDGSSRRLHAICPTELAPQTVADALADLAARGINAVPVQTMRQLADRHRAAADAGPCASRNARGTGGQTECFAPSWFAFDGDPASRPAAPPRIGSDASGDPR